jgi:hypothetical protein
MRATSCSVFENRVRSLVMNPQIIRDRINNGFRPFVLHLSDGRHLAVPHSDFVAVGRNVVVVIGEDDVSRTIDPLHIVSVEEALPKE